jgi:hypothetical protein
MFFRSLRGLLFCFKSQKTIFRVLGPKNRGVLFYMTCAAKNSEACCDVALLLLVVVCCWGVSAVADVSTFQLFIPAAASVPADVTVPPVVFLLFTLLRLLTQLMPMFFLLL